ncbi:MAG: hypothetical protein KGZ57_04330, partial [Dethiobacter sp.]|nr:hypothetical protein [Dethiobacter sp.]
MGSSALSTLTNSRRVAVGASADRLRQTRTMLEARTLVPVFMPKSRSVRIGHVPLIEKPAWTTASRKVSQPVDLGAVDLGARASRPPFSDAAET